MKIISRLLIVAATFTATWLGVAVFSALAGEEKLYSVLAWMVGMYVWERIGKKEEKG